MDPARPPRPRRLARGVLGPESVDLSLRPRLASVELGSLDSTQGGTRFLRGRLILLCKVLAFIDLTYGALFSLAMSQDSRVNYFDAFAESVSIETLGEYALFAVVALACRFFGHNAWPCRCCARS